MAATTPTMSPIDSIFDPETLSTPALTMESRPKPSRIKSCLKTPTPPRSASPTQGGKKTVVFSDEGTEEVYTADEWDRTPAEVAQRLSYQDILELKEIQRSLPKANQLPDPFSNRPHSQYLAKVPIGLLPLLPTSPAPRAAPPPPPSQSRFARPPFRPSFPFLPLLDTTTTSNTYSTGDHLDDSDCDTSTPSLTNASLDSPPPSLPSHSPSPSPDDIALNLDIDADVDSSSFDYFDIPPRATYNPYSHNPFARHMIPQNPYSRMKGTHKLPAIPSPNLPAPSPLSLYECPPVGVKSGLQCAPFLPLAELPTPAVTTTKEESGLLSDDDVQINPSTPESSVNQSHQSQKPCSISSTTCKRDFTPYFAFEREQQEREFEREQSIPPSLSRTTRVHG